MEVAPPHHLQLGQGQPVIINRDGNILRGAADELPRIAGYFRQQRRTVEFAVTPENNCRRGGHAGLDFAHQLEMGLGGEMPFDPFNHQPLGMARWA